MWVTQDFSAQSGIDPSPVGGEGSYLFSAEKVD